MHCFQVSSFCEVRLVVKTSEDQKGCLVESSQYEGTHPMAGVHLLQCLCSATSPSTVSHRGGVGFLNFSSLQAVSITVRDFNTPYPERAQMKATPVLYTGQGNIPTMLCVLANHFPFGVGLWGGLHCQTIHPNRWGKK